MRVDRSYCSNQNTWSENHPQCIVVHNTDNFAAGADARDVIRVKAAQQLRNAGHDRVPPVLRPLLCPAGVREAEGIFLCDFVLDRTVLPDKQQLAGRRAEINADK